MDERAIEIFRVGDGRGFVVQDGHDRLVVTAAHCLPHFPPCGSMSYVEERTYANLLGPLGGETSVWAECLFVDPIADIAVLGSPDGQVLYTEADAYEELVDSAAPLPVADTYDWPETVQREWRDRTDYLSSMNIDPPTERTQSGQLLSLDGRWFGCRLRIFRDSPISIEDAEGPLLGGMSGSPIVVKDAAVGVFVCSEGTVGGPHDGGGRQPRLDRDLPERFRRFYTP